jgi:hypothetical protein
MIRSLFLALLATVMLSSCGFFGGERVNGNGNVVTQTRATGDFNSIEVSGAIDVYIRQESSPAIKVETDENIQGLIITEVRGNVLRIYQEDGFNIDASTLKVYVSATSYKMLKASGACNFYTESRIAGTDNINIDLSGASDANLEISAPAIEAELSGAGSLSLKGEAKDLSISGSGSSKIRCFDLIAGNVRVDISGAGNAEVFASTKLDVEVSGAGDIIYKGNPAVSQHISGAGSVRKAE